MTTYPATISIPNLIGNSIGKNLIFNPRGQIWQKGSAMSAPAAIGGYQCDFWGHRGKGSTVFVERKQFALGEADSLGQRYFMRTTFNHLSGASNYSLIACDIDDVRNYAGGKCTLSLRIRSDINRNIALEHNQYFGDGGSASPEWRGVPITISVTTAWQDIHISIDDWPSVLGKTLGTSETDTDRIGIVLFLEAGSDFNSRTNNLGQSSGYIDIARMELRGDPNNEVSTMSNPWSDYDHETELLRCQSVLEVFSYKEIVWSGYVENNKPRWLGLPFKVTKRRLPVVTVNKITSLGFNGPIIASDISLTGVQLYGIGTSTINSGYFQADLIIDANHPYTP